MQCSTHANGRGTTTPLHEPEHGKTPASASPNRTPVITRLLTCHAILGQSTMTCKYYQSTSQAHDEIPENLIMQSTEHGFADASPCWRQFCDQAQSNMIVGALQRPVSMPWFGLCCGSTAGGDGEDCAYCILDRQAPPAEAGMPSSQQLCRSGLHCTLHTGAALGRDIKNDCHSMERLSGRELLVRKRTAGSMWIRNDVKVVESAVLHQ